MCVCLSPPPCPSSPPPAVFHPVECSYCHTESMMGFRYRCQQCHNYQLCQDCFWRGHASGSHSNQHQMKEYTSWVRRGGGGEGGGEKVCAERGVSVLEQAQFEYCLSISFSFTTRTSERGCFHGLWKENSDLASHSCVSEIPRQEIIPCPQQVAELRLQQRASPPHIPWNARETSQPRSHSVSSSSFL